MSALELFLLAVGLSMDAFAVSVCLGLSMKPANIKKAVTVGLYFGVFQGLMPLLGYLAGSRFSDLVVSFDHWIAFILLSIIGGKMILGSFEKGGADRVCADRACPAAPCPDRLCPTAPKPASVGPAAMLPLALATSIDALAIGISFAFLQVAIIPAVSFIALTTLLLSAAGVMLGKAFGTRLKAKAELAGGIILILIGTKILLEHLGVIA